MGFTTTIATCFRKYVTFSGRAPRSEFWYFVLFLLLANIVLTIINSAIFGPTIQVEQVTKLAADGTASTNLNRNIVYDGGVFGLIFMLATLLPMLAVTWRRLHDTGRPGWRILLPWVIFALGVIGMMLAAVGPGALLDGLRGTGHVNVQLPGYFLPVMLLLVAEAFIWPLVMVLRPSQPFPNKYGPNPYEVTQ